MKRVRRLKSEETQDYVREAKSTEHEEEEERTFVPSAVSVALNWQLASVVVNEGYEAYTGPTCVRSVSTNTCRPKEKNRCQMCSGQLVEKKAYRGRMWKMIGKEPYLRGTREYFLQERSRVKRFQELADEEKTGRKTRSVAA